MITPQTFQHHLDRWGSRIEAWPPAEQAAARALLATDAATRDALAAAEHLTRALQDAAEPHASDALKRRLKRIPARCQQPGRTAPAPARPRMRVWWWGGGVALASSSVMALGFVAGFTGLTGLEGSLVDWAALAYGSL